MAFFSSVNFLVVFQLIFCSKAFMHWNTHRRVFSAVILRMNLLLCVNLQVFLQDWCPMKQFTALWSQLNGLFFKWNSSRIDHISQFLSSVFFPVLFFRMRRQNSHENLQTFPCEACFYTEGRRQICWLLFFLSCSHPSGLKETLNQLRFQMRDKNEMKSKAQSQDHWWVQWSF